MQQIGTRPKVWQLEKLDVDAQTTLRFILINAILNKNVSKVLSCNTKVLLLVIVEDFCSTMIILRCLLDEYLTCISSLRLMLIFYMRAVWKTWAVLSNTLTWKKDFFLSCYCSLGATHKSESSSPSIGWGKILLTYVHVYVSAWTRDTSALPCPKKKKSPYSGYYIIQLSFDVALAAHGTEASQRLS